MIRKIIRINKDKCNGCGGLEMAAKKALQSSGKFIPWQDLICKELMRSGMFPGLPS